ncbi:MAG: hypothetical protein HY608_05630 [Planctomycetes bacterium]|nr:hypothetical protein [Planctomycetota bacterium]
MPAKKPDPEAGPPKPFGQLVVDRGFATRAQVEDALRAQRETDQAGHPHKLIGIVMLEMGFLSSTQLIEILKEYEKRGDRRQ